MASIKKELLEIRMGIEQLNKALLLLLHDLYSTSEEDDNSGKNELPSLEIEPPADFDRREYIG